MTDNGDGPKIIGEIRIQLIERAPGQQEMSFALEGVCQNNEVLARGLWDKARDLLAQLFMQKMLQAAMGQPSIAPAGALDLLKKHSRG